MTLPKTFPQKIYFYPRTPVECDTVLFVQSVFRIEFLSTHSCGVRLVYHRPYAKLRGFLSTHSCGVRLTLLIAENLIIGNFYPRTPVECDKNGQWHDVEFLNFYPRTPVECDKMPIQICSLSAKFLSTHSCGVRQTYWIDVTNIDCISIHALLWSATRR